MARKLIQDIFVKEKPKSIFPEKNQKNFEHIDQREDHPEPEEKISKNSHVFIWIICIISLGTLLFFVSSLFATATLTITPKSEPVSLNDTFSITLGTSTAAANPTYQIVSETKTLSQSLATDGEQTVSQKATGKAFIYNDYSAAAQNLLINTKLETTSGLIYLVTKAVRVPGITTVKGVKVPGSIEVDIVASEPGSQYNMKLSDLKGDFTIPGFANTPKYNSFYARLSADIVGGYAGSEETVSPTVLASSKTQLQSNLQDALIKDIYSETNPENIIFKNNYYIQYSNIPDSISSSSYIISESATIYAVSFDQANLAAFIAKNKLGDYDGSPVNAIYNDDMSVTITSKTATPWTENSLKALFSGDAIIVWSYDQTKILSEVAGQKKSILSEILSEYKPAIMQITGAIIPIWDSTFPKNTNNIKIIDTVQDATQ